MHSFSHHRHSSAGETSDKETKGLIGSAGWRYDLHEWLTDIFMFGGKVRELRQKTVDLARIQPGETVLDVGCGTGTLAMKVARRVGRVVGIDPGCQQIVRARAKAARRNVPIEFQIGVIEQLAFGPSYSIFLADPSIDIVILHRRDSSHAFIVAAITEEESTPVPITVINCSISGRETSNLPVLLFSYVTLWSGS
jgi:2-polyprenyl-3-methyl-5-hydroxy-6-metoxy-1,4-benzoquinol methylase